MPLFVMLVTSLKTMDEIRDGNLLSLPRAPTFDAWIKAWGDGLHRRGLRRHEGLFLELAQDGGAGRG